MITQLLVRCASDSGFSGSQVCSCAVPAKGADEIPALRKLTPGTQTMPERKNQGALGNFRLTLDIPRFHSSTQLQVPLIHGNAKEESLCEIK